MDHALIDRPVTVVVDPITYLSRYRMDSSVAIQALTRCVLICRSIEFLYLGDMQRAVVDTHIVDVAGEGKSWIVPSACAIRIE